MGLGIDPANPNIDANRLGESELQDEEEWEEQTPLKPRPEKQTSFENLNPRGAVKANITEKAYNSMSQVDRDRFWDSIECKTF
jgi:hypothetical protein